MPRAPAQPTRSAPPHFPLDTLGPVLAACKVPQGAFAPDATWDQTYGVYTLTGRGTKVGTVKLGRAVGAKGAMRLAIRYNRSLSGGSQRIVGTIHSRTGDLLPAPRQWEFQSEVFDAAGKPVAHTKQAKTGTLAGGVVRIKSPGGVEAHKIAGPCAITWALFSVVQMLPGEKTQLPAFTLIDHYDQIKPDYRISYRKTLDVAVGKKTVRLTAYDQIGRGNVPWVYWVDDNHRLLLVVAGLEAYVLETSRQESPHLPT